MAAAIAMACQRVASFTVRSGEEGESREYRKFIRTLLDEQLSLMLAVGFRVNRENRHRLERCRGRSP